MNQFIIEHGVLKGYSGAAAEVTIPAGVREIGYGAFRGKGTIQRVVVPAGVSRIGSQAFAGCDRLEQLVLAPGLVEIGYSAFERCSQLKTVTLPEGLLLLDRMAFLGCTALAEIQFPDTLDTVGRDALKDTAWLTAQPDGVIYAGRLALFAKGTVQQAHIRPGTVKICVDAFRGCTALCEVTLPDTLQHIEDRAFQNCRRLKQITIPRSVRHIGYRAFQQCAGLAVLLQSDEATFGRGCFEDDATLHVTGMDLARLPDNVRMSAIVVFADDICDGRQLDAEFCRCSFRYIQSRRKLLYDAALHHWNLLQVMLQQRMIPFDDIDPILDTVLAGEQAEAVAALIQYKQKLNAEADTGFSDSWDDLELGWDLPPQEKTADMLKREWGTKKNRDGTLSLMLYNGSDTELMVPSKIGDALITAIAPAACSPDRHGIRRETAAKRRRICSVNIAEGIIRIGNEAFAGCENLRQVTLPESVVEIGYEAFCRCHKLKEITIPESVEKIGRAAFAHCSSLTSVHIPQGVQVADDAFDGCPYMAEIE